MVISKGLKKCKFCFEDINEKARRCPHCQADLRGFIDRHPIISVLLGILVLIFIFFAIAFSVDSTPENISTDSTPQQPNQNVIEIGSGKYLSHDNISYDYFLSQDVNTKKFIAIFNPLLPRNDAVVTMAMLEMINRAYGKHNVADLTPELVERAGSNLIMFQGVEDDYYFLIVKEDTGEVNSFTFWTE